MPDTGFSLNVTPEELLRRAGLIGRQRKAMQAAAEVLRSTWYEELNQPGKGETYTTEFVTTKGTPRRVIPTDERVPHTASKAGDPPAPDSGFSRDSVHITEINGGDGRQVGTPLRSLLALEWGVNVPGTKVGPHPAEGFRIEARPHGRPAGEKAKPEMKKVVIETLRRGQ